MRLKSVILVACCALSVSATGGSMGDIPQRDVSAWSFIGSVGYTWFDEAYTGGPGSDPSAQAAIGDGQTVLGRFAIARDLWNVSALRLGGELGVQNGNIMRTDIPQVVLDDLGGLNPQLNIKPVIDLLATASWQPRQEMPVFGLVKLGIAYRRLQVNDRVTFNDIDQIGFEVQAGLGYQINERTNLSLNYQGIFNDDTVYTVNAVTFTGHISDIPTQNGLLLSLAYTV